jgi:hypothetical protein
MNWIVTAAETVSLLASTAQLASVLLTPRSRRGAGRRIRGAGEDGTDRPGRGHTGRHAYGRAGGRDVPPAAGTW